MSNKVELAVVQEQLGAKKGQLVTQGTVDELNKLIEDPDYGEEFLDSYINHFNIIEKNNQWSTPKYMVAMKFFTLMQSGHSIVDAYVKAKPWRLVERMAAGQGKKDMGGEASRFNSTALVNEIRKISTIPVQLIHRHLLHEAIMKTADMMTNPEVSPAVQQKAAETLIRELKPTEDSTVNIKVGMDEDTKVQQGKLVDHIGQIALNQQKMLAAGMDIAEIQRLNIVREEVIDVEAEDD